MRLNGARTHKHPHTHNGRGKLGAGTVNGLGGGWTAAAVTIASKAMSANTNRVNCNYVNRQFRF